MILIVNSGETFCRPSGACDAVQVLLALCRAGVQVTRWELLPDGPGQGASEAPSLHGQTAVSRRRTS